MSILYSVIVPVYNAEKYLEECISSVLQQTYINYELILVNDGSQDLSGEICNDYQKKDDRIKVIHQENQGSLIARRNALNEVEGEYCLFLDSDDYWDKDLLENVNNAIDEYKCDLVIFDLIKVDSKQNKLITTIFDSEINFENQKDILFEKIINSTSLNSLSIKAIKSSLFDQTDYSFLKNIKNGEDLLQTLPLIANAKKVVYINKPLYYYRMNFDSITHNFNINQYKTSVVVRGSVLEYIKALNLDSEKNLRDFYRFYCKSILYYVSRLSISKVKKKTKIKILKEILNEDLYVGGLKYINDDNFSHENKIRHHLFSKKMFDLLFMYEFTIKLLKVILSKVKMNKIN